MLVVDAVELALVATLEDEGVPDVDVELEERPVGVELEEGDALDELCIEVALDPPTALEPLEGPLFEALELSSLREDALREESLAVDGSLAAEREATESPWEVDARPLSLLPFERADVEVVVPPPSGAWFSEEVATPPQAAAHAVRGSQRRPRSMAKGKRLMMSPA